MKNERTATPHLEQRIPHTAGLSTMRLFDRCNQSPGGDSPVSKGT